jgi:hypothetical protein
MAWRSSRRTQTRSGPPDRPGQPSRALILAVRNDQERARVGEVAAVISEHSAWAEPECVGRLVGRDYPERYRVPRVVVEPSRYAARFFSDEAIPDA